MVAHLRRGLQLPQANLRFSPLIHHLYPAPPPIVERDVPDNAIAGIFSLRTDDGEAHPVAFYARTLSSVKLNYNTHDKELLAIFEAFKTWRHYLESPHRTIDVITDHKTSNILGNKYPYSLPHEGRPRHRVEVCEPRPHRGATLLD
jgi:hypothetical protein